MGLQRRDAVQLSRGGHTIGRGRRRPLRRGEERRVGAKGWNPGLYGAAGGWVAGFTRRAAAGERVRIGSPGHAFGRGDSLVCPSLGEVRNRSPTKEERT